MRDRNDDRHRSHDEGEWFRRRDADREQRAGSWKDESDSRWGRQEHFGDRGQQNERGNAGWERGDDWRNNQNRDWRSEQSNWNAEGYRPDERYGNNQSMYGERQDYGRQQRGWDNRMNRERETDRNRAATETKDTHTWSAGHGAYTDQNTYGSGYNQSYGGGLSSWQTAGGGNPRVWGEDRDRNDRGRHFGKGPKNWQRNDERIREDVNERLTDHPDVDASEVQATVSNGEVTLTGTVDDRQAKRHAEECAWGVSGVREVHNQLRVNSRESQESNQSGGSGNFWSR